jgi:hypothetical protein
MIKPDYEIIDDFVPDYTNEHIDKVLSGIHFPWFLADKVKTKNIENELQNNQLFHLIYFYKDLYKSNYYSLIEPILKKLDIDILLKVKINCTTYTDKIFEFPFHVDTEHKAKTCVYYVNDNNGYTYFKDNSKVYSKARRLVKFDSHHLHSGTTSSNTKYRFVININYIPKEMITYDKEI